MELEIRVFWEVVVWRNQTSFELEEPRQTREMMRWPEAGSRLCMGSAKLGRWWQVRKPLRLFDEHDGPVRGIHLHKFQPLLCPVPTRRINALLENL
ncbi:hypothetical protein Droror1_Dr00028016, partial [Drosera rotundifolia]